MSILAAWRKLLARLWIDGKLVVLCGASSVSTDDDDIDVAVMCVNPVAVDGESILPYKKKINYVHRYIFPLTYLGMI